ncbi:uncharacterized protein LOC143039557 [Oratosquilla oratoria]|uniref:uncharacterized protein LOC143039557 n=1 Tax=Oratosquilla oratoria TaxID=337810 RepID=UPI003F76BACB
MAAQGLLPSLPLLLLLLLQVLAAPSPSVSLTNPSSDLNDDLTPAHEEDESSLVSSSFLEDASSPKHLSKRSAPPSSPNTWMPLSARKNPWDQKIGSLSDEDLLHLIRVVSQRYNGDSNEERAEGGGQEDSVVAGEKRALAFLAKNNDLPKSIMRKKVPTGETAVGPSVETSLEKDAEDGEPEGHEEDKEAGNSPSPSPSPTEGPQEEKRGISSIVRNKSYLVGGKRSLSTLVKNRDLPVMGLGGVPANNDPPSEKKSDLPFQMKNIATLTNFNSGSDLQSSDETTGDDPDVQFEEEKRHIGSLVSSGNYPFSNRYSKRYFASLLKSSRPFVHPRFDDYDQKRFYASLLKGGGSERQKKYFASLLKSNTSPFTSYSNPGLGKRFIDPDYEDLVDTEQEIEKKHIGSLFRDNNDDKRYFASLLDDQEAEKRHIGSLRGKKSFDGSLDEEGEEVLDAKDVEKKHIGSLRAGKRYYASLLDNKSAEKKHIGSLRGGGSRYFSSMQNVEKKHIGSLRGFGKRHYSSLLDDDSQEVQKKHISSLLSGKRDEKRYFGSSLDEEDADDDDQESTDASFVAGEKRHFSSLLGDPIPEKKHYSSLLRSNSDDKRHFSSLLDDNNVEKKHIGSLLRGNDKRYYASLLDDHDVDKKHIGSLFRDNDKRYYASLLDDQDIDKKHIGSLLRGRSEDKRYFASLLDDHDVDKKHIGSLFRDSGDKRFYGSILDDREMDKKHIGSLFQDNDKRYYASLLDDHDVDKKHIGSLLRDDKRFYGSLLDDRDKKHISSLLRNREGKRFYSSLLDDHEAEKKHISSLLRSNTNTKRFFDSLPDLTPLSETVTEESAEDHEGDQSQEDESASHQRTKRYIGALAKNNNLPFISTSRHYRRDVDAYRSPTPYSFYLEGLIQDALKKEFLKRRLLEASEDAIEEQKRNIQSLARIGIGYKTYPGKRNFDEVDDYDERNEDFDEEEEEEEEEPDNDYLVNNDDKRSIASLARNNWLPPYHKRFLGSLARQGWFPRQFRGFHVDDSPSKRRLGGILPFTYSPY